MDNERLSPHFTRKEFACKCGCGYDRISMVLVGKLENIRTHFGRPVTINSGCRCKKHNAAVGGESASRHLTGDAADITVEGVPPSKVADYAEKINPSGGVGRYKTFTHIDTRGRKARWHGR